jgi:hypothetical protein
MVPPEWHAGTLPEGAGCETLGRVWDDDDHRREQARMDIDVTNHYPADVATVFAMITDPEFLEQRYAVVGATHVSVSCEEDGGTFRITIDRTVPVTVPAFARRVLQPTTNIHQVDEWSLEDREEMQGTWSVKAKGLPIEMQGDIRLVPSGSGCDHEITGEMHVGVPLIGGRLKRFLLGDTLESISGEHAFGVAWLAGEV